MKRAFLFAFFLTVSVPFTAQTSRLKAVLYDFDGFDIGQTNLPDGDYSLFDLDYRVAVNPLSLTSEVLGDRVLQLDLNWQTGSGEFAKSFARFIELNRNTDRLNFYLYNPPSNNSDTTMKLTLTEDDNNSGVFESSADDKWTCTVNIPETNSWQLISVPLSSFTDNNTGGNGIFDIGFTNNAGKLLSVNLVFTNTTQSPGPEQYFVDMICFSEGALPTGPTILDLPPVNPSDSCELGALTNQASADSTPIEIESLFPPGKKLTYVNWFMPLAESGTTPNLLPGQSVTNLLNQGYIPVITWEMMYADYPRLDPVQPRLNNLLNGDFDTYLDDFADQVVSYNDTIIMRIFHEFDGDWYCWSLSENGQDPQVYISAFRYVVDRFRARGATKVKWMWCPNAEPKPYTAYNWIISAYPGDSYVDIVATDIYNHPNSGVPPWRSFRYGVSESYYYLTSYFPQKPFFICEVACRERYTGEDVTSQTKAGWTCTMSRDLETYFNKTKALIFFSANKEHDWRINSTAQALDGFRQCIWNNTYFGGPVAVPEHASPNGLSAYPNPFSSQITVELAGLAGTNYQINVCDVTGKQVLFIDQADRKSPLTFGEQLPSGMYIIELRSDTHIKKIKVVKTTGG